MVRQVSIVVRGDVQGVFFRAEAKKAAEALGLVGWVKNESEGSVVIVAEGKEGQLQKFVAWCRRGPKGSRVEELKIQWAEATGEFSRFEIKL